MQPVYIRLIDNLRKQLEQSDWKGDYEEFSKWSEEVSDETKARIALLQSELETASPEATTEIQATLAQLPSPYPGYALHLTQGDRRVTVDLWDLCYQICFRDYDSDLGVSRLEDGSPGTQADVDRTLFEADTGEVDWNSLDQKTQAIVAQVFANLPG